MDTLCVVGGDQQAMTLAMQLVEQRYTVLLLVSVATRIPLDLEAAVQAGRLTISREVADIERVACIFLCLEATSLIGFVESALKYLHHDSCLVIRSFVPVGTGDHLQEWLVSQGSGSEVIVFPVIMDGPLVLGGDTLKKGVHQVRQLLSLISLPIIITNRKEAEMIHFAKSCFQAIKKSLMNQLALLCGSMEIDVVTVTRIIGIDKNIGQSIFQDGLGALSTPILRDLQMLAAQAKEIGIKAPLLTAMIEMNSRPYGWAVDTLRGRYPEMRGISIAIWGKCDAISTSEFSNMLTSGVQFHIYDPSGCMLDMDWVPNKEQVRWSATAGDSVEGVHGLLILEERREYVEADLAAVKRCMKVPLLIDQKNLFPSEMMKEWGFEYVSVGRKV